MIKFLIFWGIIRRIKRILEALFILITIAIATSAIVSAAAPTIEFSGIPPYGTAGNLQGKVTNVDSASYKVAVYIYIDGYGWYTKPTYNSPLTIINSDGTWSANIGTGANDIYATKVKAYIVPNNIDVNSIRMSGNGVEIFPAALEANAVASLETQKRPLRHIMFSGRDWIVKFSGVPVGPGLNYFSDSDQNVWVDGQGNLHLKITKVSNSWYSSEVILNESLGYGEYVFYTASRIYQLDKNVVLGMFTWDTEASSNHYREIDIEYSKFGNATDSNNVQYVIQPWANIGNIYRFNANLSRTDSINAFRWSADNVSFRSLQGENLNTLNSSDIISSWVYNGNDNPPPGKENARINIWLFDPNNILGQPPSDGKEAEVIISKFEFIYPNGTVSVPALIPTPAPTS